MNRLWVSSSALALLMAASLSAPSLLSGQSDSATKADANAAADLPRKRRVGKPGPCLACPTVSRTCTDFGRASALRRWSALQNPETESS